MQYSQARVAAKSTCLFTALSSTKENPRVFSYRFWKDIADRLVALILVIITSPLMIAISLAIRFDTKGKAIFAQERVGKDSSNFTVYKFRSMIVNNDETKYKEYISKYVMENAPYRVDETGQKIFKVDDPAVTRVGKWLRKTNLDELPQFFNVLKGDMSFIGPRPDIPFAVAMYNDNQWNRLRVKPGITGLWQVSGRRSRSFTDMVRLDNFYIKKQSLKLDIKILLGTIKVILNMDGS